MKTFCQVGLRSRVSWALLEKGHAADIAVTREVLMRAGWMGTDHRPDIVEPDVLRQRNSRMKVVRVLRRTGRAGVKKDSR